MWAKRDVLWQQLTGTPHWDVVIVGGGITGAGILREAARAGMKAILIEQRDFAWGTSSRSSKLVHGGLRYLRQGQLNVTMQSVRERDDLLEAGAGLVQPLGFLMPAYKDQTRKIVYRMALSVYDLMAMRWAHREYTPEDIELLAPRLNPEGLEGGFYFEDAQTDDARLTLRVMQEAVAAGGLALNYVRADELIRDGDEVSGVQVRDVLTGTTHALKAHAVINATGAWVDRLREQLGEEKKIRPLRGSHLIFPSWRFPVAQAVSFPHPDDGRPVFVFPWEEITLVGTTDIDHEAPLDEEPSISGDEVAYLLAACNVQFPSLNLSLDDIVATYAGVRPVVGTGKIDPSKESRDHVVWNEKGLLSVTGGKLTTFRLIALDALGQVVKRLPGEHKLGTEVAVLESVDVVLPPQAQRLTEEERQRLIGRYGANAPALVEYAQHGELTPVPGSRTLWAELRWAVHAEAVVHLEDLMLRRTRLGLTLPRGGLDQLETIYHLCRAELDWDDARWNDEIVQYRALIRDRYGLPPRYEIPDWRKFSGGEETPPAPAEPAPTDTQTAAAVSAEPRVAAVELRVSPVLIRVLAFVTVGLMTSALVFWQASRVLRGRVAPRQDR